MKSKFLAIFLALALISTVSFAYADVDISVTQENLTEAEQATLDKIAESRSGNGTYFQYPTVVIPHVISDTSPLPACETDTTGFVPITICIFRGVAPDGSEPIWDIEEEKWTSETILEQEAKEAYDEYIEQQVQLAKSPDEKRIEYLEAKANPTPDDLEEIALLEQLGALCKNDTLVSQTYREFDVPTIIFRNFDGNMTEVLVQDKSIRTDKIRNNANIKDLRLAVQECIGQPHTKKSIQYDHIIVDDVFSEQIDRTGSIPTWSQSRVNQESNFGLQLTVDNPMCASYNSDSTKRDYGCPDFREYPKGSGAPETQSYEDHPLMKKFKAWQEDPDSQLQESIDKAKNKHASVSSTYGGSQD